VTPHCGICADCNPLVMQPPNTSGTYALRAFTRMLGERNEICDLFLHDFPGGHDLRSRCECYRLRAWCLSCGVCGAAYGWSIHEAGMAQLDDDVGLVMKKLKDIGVDDNTIVVFTTDNGTELFTWPDGGQTPFAQSKGTVLEGGFRVPAMIRWPGHVPAGKVENGIISGLDWFPTFLAAAGDPNIIEELKKGKELDGTTYKVHLDGYNQMDVITGKGPSNRHEVWYFGESELGAVRIDDYKYRFIDQRGGWLGDKTKPDVPYITNLRLDPFERTGWPDNGTAVGAQQYFDWFKYEFWRFVFVQQEVEKLAMTAIEFPPMQKGASFNLDAVKAKIQAARAATGK
jgi:hypothetical protein